MLPSCKTEHPEHYETLCQKGFNFYGGLDDSNKLDLKRIATDSRFLLFDLNKSLYQTMIIRQKVYKALNIKDNSLVAIKVVKVEKFKEVPKVINWHIIHIVRRIYYEWNIDSSNNKQ